MCLIMEINSYLSCIEDEKIYYQKKLLMISEKKTIVCF